MVLPNVAEVVTARTGSSHTMLRQCVTQGLRFNRVNNFLVSSQTIRPS